REPDAEAQPDAVGGLWDGSSTVGRDSGPGEEVREEESGCETASVPDARSGDGRNVYREFLGATVERHKVCVAPSSGLSGRAIRFGLAEAHDGVRGAGDALSAGRVGTEQHSE